MTRIGGAVLAVFLVSAFAGAAGAGEKCHHATEGDSLIAEACAEGGRDAARKKMKELVDAANKNGGDFKCGRCHAESRTFELKDNAHEDFMKLLEAAGVDAPPHGSASSHDKPGHDESDPAMKVHEASDPAMKPHDGSDPARKPHDASDPAMKPHDGSDAGMEPMEAPLGIPDSRGGSGTGWLPDNSAVHGLHAMAGKWMFMLHWNVFAGFDYQSGPRGGQRFLSLNWVMGMARVPLGGGLLEGRLMLSLEPLTVGGGGYPLLLQTGETWRDEPLFDRQHPHDLFMEIAAIYTRRIAGGFAFQIYLAPAGEPALGPVAFPHRPSAASDPLAPLGHHWQDSTHISFGVLTAGLFTRHVKLEGSWFNGREPNEMRYDLDLRVPDSFSGRLSVNPVRWASLQVSYGFLKSPESLEPDVSVHRVTASAAGSWPVAGKGTLDALALWGRNVPEEGPATDAFLVEATLSLAGHNVFARAEYARKTARDLVLSMIADERVFDVAAFVLGYLYELGPFISLLPGVGVRGSINFVGPDLGAYYGTRTPVGIMAFVRLRPAAVAAARPAEMAPARPAESAPARPSEKTPPADRGDGGHEM